MGSGRRRKLWKIPGGGYKKRYNKYYMPTNSKPGLPGIRKKGDS